MRCTPDCGLFWLEFDIAGDSARGFGPAIPAGEGDAAGEEFVGDRIAVILLPLCLSGTLPRGKIRVRQATASTRP